MTERWKSPTTNKHTAPLDLYPAPTLFIILSIHYPLSIYSCQVWIHKTGQAENKCVCAEWEKPPVMRAVMDRVVIVRWTGCVPSSCRVMGTLSSGSLCVPSWCLPCSELALPVDLRGEYIACQVLSWAKLSFQSVITRSDSQGLGIRRRWKSSRVSPSWACARCAV